MCVCLWASGSRLLQCLGNDTLTPAHLLRLWLSSDRCSSGCLSRAPLAAGPVLGQARAVCTCPARCLRSPCSAGSGEGPGHGHPPVSHLTMGPSVIFRGDAYLKCPLHAVLKLTPLNMVSVGTLLRLVPRVEQGGAVSSSPPLTEKPTCPAFTQVASRIHLPERGVRGSRESQR